METFTAKVILADGTEKNIYNCTHYKGKIGVVRHKGLGDVKYTNEGDEYYDKYIPCIMPFLNKDLLEENGLTQESADKLIKNDPEHAIYNQRIFNCMFTLGENKGGKICIDETALKAEERRKKESEQERKILQKEVRIFSTWCFRS